MTAVVVVLVVALVAVAALVVWSQGSTLRRRGRARVLVTLKSGAAFDGVLYEQDRRVWVLRSAQAIGAGDRDTNVPVDGEVLIFTADIEYVQKP